MIPSGPCLYNEGSERKWGVRLPKYGARCVPVSRVKEDMTGSRANVPASRISGGNELSSCYPKNVKDIVLDNECRKEYGSNTGLKKRMKCPSNNNKVSANCGEGYQLGEKISENSTKCVPVGTDMNIVCNRVMKKKSDSKYLNYGYKYQTSKGCPDNFMRAECSGNYYGGDELYDDYTDCVREDSDLNIICQNKFGTPLTFSKNVKTTNCLPGYVRGHCVNIKKK